MVLRVTKANPKLQSKQTKSKNSCSVKCAVSISNKVSKKSVTRNKLRRLFHQHLSYRLSNMILDHETWAFISLKPNSIKNPSTTLLRECDKLLLKAGLS